MNKRTKTLTFIGLLLLAFIGVVFLASHFILLGSFLELEARDMRANVGRVLNAIEIQQDNVATIASGYSMWDETYRFVRGDNQELFDRNLMDTAFADYDVNVTIYLNDDLEIVYEKAVDQETNTELPVPVGIYQHLTAGSPLVSISDPESAVNGILSLPEGVLMLSSQPIVTSERDGPIAGIQIWGRYLYESFFEHLSETTNFSVTAQRYLDENWPDDFKQATQYVDLEGGIFVEPLDDADVIAGYTVLHDLYGQPAIMLRVDAPRAIYKQGQTSINYFVLAMILSGFVFSGLAQSRMTLQRENVELEWLVEERTAELSRANAQLRQEIAERTRAEEALEKARDEALEALQIKTKIMANVSHDVRTPLTTIVLRTELLKRGRYGMLTPEQQGILDLILTNTRQLLNFVSNLLTEAQFGGENIAVANVVFSPSVLIDEVFAMLMPVAERKQLTLTGSVGADVPETLRGDPIRLQQILTNLLENAIRFTERGTIAVTIERTGETHWAMRVSDTGRGIPAEMQSHIFEAFWQIDGSMTREVSRGVGLGLSIVRQLTALLGGEITLESAPGHGSTFTVTFPIKSKE